MYTKHTFTSVTERYIPSIKKYLKDCIATDESGKVYEKLTLWKNDWEQVWTNIKEGYTLVGEVKETEKNGFKNFTLYPERTNTLNPKRTPSNITAAMNKKAENIKEAQENRAEGVKIASTFRDATLITNSRMTENHGNTSW